MKNFIKLGLLTAMILTTLGVTANDDRFVLKTNDDNGKSIVFLVNEAQNINLSIIASDSEVVYEQKIRTVGPAKKVYNLDAFPNGNYELRLESETKLTTYQISIENGKAELSNPTVKEFFKPVIVREKGMLILDLKTSVVGIVDVVVLNEYNEALIKKEFAKGKSVQKFDITTTDARELTFIVKYNGQEHIETISIR